MIAVNIDWPAHRELNGQYVFAEMPRVGDVVQIGLEPGEVKNVVWFFDEDGRPSQGESIRVVIR